MTDNEIIKALDCCTQPNGNDCYNCPRWIKNCDSTIECAVDLIADAHNLITRQKAEIETLKEKNRNAMRCTPKAIRRAKAEAIKEFWAELQRVIVINNTHDGYMDLAIDWNCLLEDGNEIVKEMAGDV